MNEDAPLCARCGEPLDENHEPLKCGAIALALEAITPGSYWNRMIEASRAAKAKDSKPMA